MSALPLRYLILVWVVGLRWGGGSPSSPPPPPPPKSLALTPALHRRLLHSA